MLSDNLSMMESVLSDIYRDHGYTCSCCGKTYSELDNRWMEPHPSCGELPESKRLVCSQVCAALWREDHWDTVEEYNYEKEREFFRVLEELEE